MTVGLGVLVGIIAFLVVEKLQRLFIGEGGHGHSHGGPQQVPAKAEKKDDGKKKKEKAKSSDDEGGQEEEDGKKEGEMSRVTWTQICVCGRAFFLNAFNIYSTEVVCRRFNKRRRQTEGRGRD